MPAVEQPSPNQKPISVGETSEGGRWEMLGAGLEAAGCVFGAQSMQELVNLAAEIPSVRWCRAV